MTYDRDLVRRLQESAGGFWTWDTAPAHETTLAQYVNAGPVLPQHVRDANLSN